MARALGLGVVAEGVERSDQAERLQALGCALGQGFLFARPLAPTTLRTWLERRPGLIEPDGHVVPVGEGVAAAATA
jgi:EAL domain-containing protein (putative c-di-GMP-specific phosphodiesterase class I)